jgi:hypothetical protein
MIVWLEERWGRRRERRERVRATLRARRRVEQTTKRDRTRNK